MTPAHPPHSAVFDPSTMPTADLLSYRLRLITERDADADIVARQAVVLRIAEVERWIAIHNVRAQRRLDVGDPPDVLDAESLIRTMRSVGHDHLVHYAGAAHRDPVAHALCVAYLADPMASEPVLASRALKAAYGWDVSPEALAGQAVR